MFKSLKLKDLVTVLGYCGLFAIVAPPVALLALRAWVSGGIVPSIIREAAAPIGGIGMIAAGAFGIYLGLLGLLWLDNMKRFTALILSVGTAAALVLFDQLGVFLRYLTLTNLGAAVVGFMSAGVLGGGLRVFTGGSKTQYPRASGGFFLLSTLIGVVSFLQVYGPNTAVGPAPRIFTDQLPQSALWAGTTNPIVDAAAVLLFLGSTFGLVTYKVSDSFQVLGPPRSGKTTLQVGFYHVTKHLDEGQTKPNPSNPLARIYERFLSADGWGPLDEATPSLEFSELSFQYRIGGAFDRIQEVEAYDVAGEHFGRILVKRFKILTPDRVVSLAGLSLVRHGLARPFMSRPEQGSMDDNTEMADMITREILFKDELLFVIDAKSLLSDNEIGPEEMSLPEYLGVYRDILQTLDESILPEKDIHVVVTKADHLRPLYNEFRGQRVAFDGGDHYEAFREFVEYLLKEREDICPITNEFFRMAPNARVNVVHYEMEDADDGDRKIPAEPVKVYGFEETLEAITNG